jgi:hypothetical protein
MPGEVDNRNKSVGGTSHVYGTQASDRYAAIKIPGPDGRTPNDNIIPCSHGAQRYRAPRVDRNIAASSNTGKRYSASSDNIEILRTSAQSNLAPVCANVGAGTGSAYGTKQDAISRNVYVVARQRRTGEGVCVNCAKAPHGGSAGEGSRAKGRSSHYNVVTGLDVARADVAARLQRDIASRNVSRN